MTFHKRQSDLRGVHFSQQSGSLYLFAEGKHLGCFLGAKGNIVDDEIAHSGFLQIFRLSDFVCPALGIFELAPLDACQRIVQGLGNSADLSAADGIANACVAKLTDGRYDSSRTRTPSLLQRAVLGSCDQLVNAQTTLGNGIARVTQHLQAGLSGNTGQDRACECGGDDLAVDLEHNVHRAHLFDVLALHTVQPKHLGISLLLGLIACSCAGSIVAAALDMSRTALDGAHVLTLDHDLDGVDSLLVVRAAGRGDDHKYRFVDTVYAKVGIVAEHEGTDIERGTLGLGNPCLLVADKLGVALQRILFGDGGQAESFCADVHTADVLQGTEHLHLAVGQAAVSLQALKDLCTVMQHGGCGMQGNIAKGNDSGIMPALFLVV